ncbi:amidohydrolase family protein [bacterium]|nr:amidohydrolase family protein [bacterium]
MRHTLFLSILWAVLLPDALQAQNDVAAKPIVGLRENPVAGFAFVNAEVVVSPSQTIADATVLVEGASITAVGQQQTIPAGYQIIDCEGKRIYPGLIDAWSESDVAVNQSLPGYWNGNVTPQVRAAAAIEGTVPDASKLRSQGIAARLIAPKGGIVKGSSCVMLTGEGSKGRSLLLDDAWQHLLLTVPRSGSRARYPNSPMGAIALLRQSFHDADWYKQAWNAYSATPQLDRPDRNIALQVLADAIDSQTFLIDAPNDRMAIRADSFAREFSLQAIIRGSGQEYRQLDEIIATNRPYLLPVDFPDAPDVKTADAARDVTLQELMHWELAPENPARMADAGVKICLTTDGLDDVGKFLKQVRVAVARGLEEEQALAALTVVPAELLGVQDEVGRIESGMIANLVITDGNLFSEGTKVLECWVAGERFVIGAGPKTELPVLAGKWEFSVHHADVRNLKLRLELEGSEGKISGSVFATESADKPAKQRKQKNKRNEQKEQPKVVSAKLQDSIQQRDRFTANLNLSEVDKRLPPGISQMTIITLESDGDVPDVIAALMLPSGDSQHVILKRLDDVVAVAEVEGDSSVEVETNPKSDAVMEDAKDDADSSSKAYSQVRFPFGAFGADERIAERGTVLFRNATVWTCDEAGKLEDADVLIRDGLIVKVGSGIKLPAECRVVDASGKHITPGLIDCHSHMGTDGGVNESGQAVTSEVRIGDFIDNSDIQIYRQLAGGLTTSNILHGSANPIGGQNQVIKLRWSQTMDGLKMKEAPKGIKFALGENVKRNQSRYPNTRMGVEQIIRDQLLAAREYQAKWRRWKSGQHDTLPPRIDLQLEALSEVQNGERWIHCHSYRQDEIVATLDVLEEFGVQIGTLQHILEGYKVADRMARHGAMGSSFSDWWAYKFEVLDAIPYNGALMHDRGVVVSFNSDDRELARHLNTEAAKATKYGGVPEVEALKFVTLNPAKQLRIDQYVGSLRKGKHADLVVWSGRPLSTLTRCEQTWVDGRCYFDLRKDRDLQSRDSELRARLIQKVLNGGRSASKSTPKEIAEEDRWVKHDVHCAAHGSHEYDYTGNLKKN